MAAPPSTFADFFWAGNGYEVVEKQATAGRDSLDRAAKVMHDLAALESEYAKGLAKIAKAAQALCKEDLASTRTFWETFRAELETQAKIHGATGFAVENDVAKPLQAARDETTKQLKAIDKRYTAAEKAFSTAKTTEQKARKQYMGKAQDAESVTISYERTAKSGPEKEAAKHVASLQLEKSSSKLRKEAEAAGGDEARSCTEKEFRTAVRQVHTTRMAYEQAFVSSCLEYEALEQSRLKSTAQIAAKYSVTCQEMQPPMQQGVQQSLDNVASSAAAIDPAADLATFANGHQTGGERGPEVFFQTFELDPNSVVDEARRREALQRQHADLVHEIDMERKELGSVQNLIKVYVDTPSFTNAVALAALQQHSASSTNYIAKLDALAAAYASMLSSVGGTPLVSPSTSAGSGGGSMPAAALATSSTTSTTRHTIAVSDRASSTTSLPGSGSAAGARQSVAGASKAGGAASSIRGSIVVSRSDTASATSASAAAVAPPPISKSRTQMCTILYDFTATGEGELSVHEGAVVPLLSTTDPDWWTIEVDGQIGYVPASYVQVN